MKAPSITVSIPVYKSRGYLRKAVKCILTQTFREFELLVISDADPDNSIKEIQNIKDSRLKIIELKENIGRYAIDHMVVTELSKSDYFVPVDSDDWCTNHYLITLLNLLSEAPDLDVGFAAQYIKRGYSRRIQRVRPWNGTDELIWHAHMSALWRRQFLIDYNLTNPNFRIAWDSIVTSVPWLVGNVAYTQKPRYYRVKRNNSLTSDPETGFGSDHRNRVKAYIIDLWKELVYNKDDKEKIKQILKRSRNEQY
jgi:glycosyltransferase involved in cell wall biosynthesis